MVKKIFLMLMVALSCGTFISWGQNTDKTVTLVVSGEGLTKEEATKNALRSAIEQAFGTFVSANTEVVNDELIKDEIVSVTSGNIQSYKELGYTELDLGSKLISLEAVVSIEKLQTYAQNKGMSTELAGNVLTMNIRLMKLNRENERKAIENLFKQMTEIAKNVPLFDYSLYSEVQHDEDNDEFFAKGFVKVSINQNYRNLSNLYKETLSSLASLRMGEKCFDFENYYYTEERIERRWIGSRYDNFKETDRKCFVLSNNYKDEPYIAFFNACVLGQILNFKIKDNLGYESKFYNVKKKYDYYIGDVKIPSNLVIKIRPMFNFGENKCFLLYSNNFNIPFFRFEENDLFLFGRMNCKPNKKKDSNIEYDIDYLIIPWYIKYTEEEMMKLTKIEVIPYDNKFFSNMSLEEFMSEYSQLKG